MTQDDPRYLDERAYQATQTILAMLATQLAELDIPAFIATAERAEAIAPAIDPTLCPAGRAQPP